MEQIQTVEDVQLELDTLWGTPLSQSIQLEAQIQMEEPQIVQDLEASLQLPLDNANETENQNSSIHKQILIEEAQIVVDVQASPLSESTPLSEAPIVVDLKASLQRELNTIWGNANEAENFTIFRTPHNISQTKKNLFEPSVISIGPFHHGQKHLQAMEEHKMRLLRDFLFRYGHISLDLCISEMKYLEMITRRCYNETFDDLDSNAFVKMMLLDGCFVLEYFLKWWKGGNLNEVGWNDQFINCDLLLQENQIPFFIVDKLYELIGLNQDARMISVKFIAYSLLPIGSIIQDPRTEIHHLDFQTLSGFPDPPAEIHHLVHLYYHYLVPNHLILPDVLSFTGNFSSMVIPSATELKQKGVNFRPKRNPKHMLDISFEYGVLKIPRLKFGDSTKPILANLLAFEHSKYSKENKPITSIVSFLDFLVNTPNDVTILQECGIIENWLGNEEELANFTNQVTEGVVMDEDHYLARLYMQVNRYIESSWHRNRAAMIRDYFDKPWRTITFFAIILTFVQTFFAVFSYILPPSP